jgi:FkbM family methyltransferase
MGFGLLKFFNSYLKKRGLIIKDSNEYEEQLAAVEHEWLKKLNINTILDIGASNGGYATKARKIFPQAKIISFEPLPNSFNALQKKFANDKLHNAFNIVLSDVAGEMEFFENDYSGSSSILSMTENHIDAYPQTAHAKRIIVQSKTLDEIFDTLKIESETLMKIDVQGAESMVLKGSEKSLEKIKLIFVESSFVELYKNQWLFDNLYQFLIQRNFKLVGIENVSQSLNDGSFLQMDAYFINEKLK